ncbi:esterase/lipase family protein [Leptolyngbya sp. PCC 6406]|uniref:esterase/lipase family protein n=1 Tax=Leptolyngbya sp. PCC 6406 TaxID=1173264 RepID=UPI0002AC178E|nr:PGAP1-like protein [Leptolyngbya sp. PCC 6406]
MPLPTVIIPGYLAGAAPYRPLETYLQQQGIPAMTVPLIRRDWIPTLGGRSVQPILTAIAATVTRLQSETGCDGVNIVGHSAGGWIARIYLGEQPYAVHNCDRDRPNCWSGHKQVHTLLTLGTPHISQERWTRRNLDFVNQTYPGAFYNSVRYVCVAGKAIYGKRWGTWFTYNSYQLTCGQGDCWGDGITPITAAHLDNAQNLLLENVYHSPRPDGDWYGNAAIAAQWLPYLT